MNKRRSSTLFVMKPTKGAEFALKKWLDEKEFDEITTGWNDVKGNPGIGLLSSKRAKNERMGIIICLDDSFAQALTIIENHLGYGDGEDNE